MVPLYSSLLSIAAGIYCKTGEPNLDVNGLIYISEVFLLV